MTMGNYDHHFRSISRLNNLEASNIYFGDMSTKQLHRCYDIGITGQHKHIMWLHTNLCGSSG